MSKKRMTVHYRYGCPWADGQLQMSDTVSVLDWYQVTCGHCLRLKRLDYAGRKAHKFHVE